VILVDANILIYAHVQSFAQCESARDWLDQQLNGSTRVGLPWVSLMAFLRLVTSRWQMRGTNASRGETSQARADQKTEVDH